MVIRKSMGGTFLAINRARKIEDLDEYLAESTRFSKVDASEVSDTKNFREKIKRRLQEALLSKRKRSILCSI